MPLASKQFIVSGWSAAGPLRKEDDLKKRKLKRLVLHRETLVELDRLELRQVGGAWYTDVYHSCPEACQWSGRRTCTTCELTCTTNFC
jgi:hypothetical protein